MDSFMVKILVSYIPLTEFEVRTESYILRVQRLGNTRK